MSKENAIKMVVKELDLLCFVTHLNKFLVGFEKDIKLQYTVL